MTHAGRGAHPQEQCPFRVASAALRIIETGDALTLPCDNSPLTFPATLAPILRRMASEASGFTIPDVVA